MKKLLSALLILALLLPVTVYADQADDLIQTLTDRDKAAVQSALVLADANHRSGQPYVVKIRTADGTTEYSLTEEEYNKLKSWVEGNYKPDSTKGKDTSALEHTNKWKIDNGYTFPIYGSTSAGLTPISDYLTILSENNILLSLPELQITDKEEYDWISSEIGDLFWLLYRPYHDGSKYAIQLQIPYSYRPMEDAFTLLLSSVLSLKKAEAKDLFDKLRYNIVNESCEIKTDEYEVIYSEPRLSNGKLADFAVLEVVKIIEQKSKSGSFHSLFSNGG